MSSDIVSIIDELIREEQNVFGVAIIGRSGSLISQTENWDVSNDLPIINDLINSEKGISSILLQGLKYMIVENSPERKIGTNIKGKGHIIICPVPVGGSGALMCYINPQVGPRDALFTVQNFAQKLIGLI
ncbi:MAG: hypothetical protein ACTSUT_13800 [Promethearchaeota archaeon]